MHHPLKQAHPQHTDRERRKEQCGRLHIHKLHRMNNAKFIYCRRKIGAFEFSRFFQAVLRNSRDYNPEFFLDRLVLFEQFLKFVL